MAPRGITAPRAPCRSCPKVRVKPRGKRTFWKVVAALVVGSLVAEMQQLKIGPFRDMSWKARRYAAVPERPAPATPTLAAATGPDPATVIAEAEMAPSGHVSAPAHNRTSSLLMVVGHMRRWRGPGPRRHAGGGIPCLEDGRAGPGAGELRVNSRRPRANACVSVCDAAREPSGGARAWKQSGYSWRV